MTIKMNKIILSWVAICFLIPAELKIVGISVLDLFVYSMVGLSLMSWLSKGSQLRLRSGVEKSLILFFIAMTISYLYNCFSSFDEQQAFVASLGLSSDFLFVRLTTYGFLTALMITNGYHIVASTITKQEDVESVIRLIITSGMFNALVTTIYWAITTGCTFDRYNFIPPIEGSQGIHLNYMSVVCLIAIASLVSGKITIAKKMYLYWVIALTGFSMLTVMVRQGWIMFLISIIIFFFLYMLKKPSHISRKKLCSLGLIFFSVIFALIVKNQSLLLDLFTDVFSISGTDSDQGSWLMRFALIQQGLNLFFENPLFGVGFGHYPAYSTVPIFNTGVETFVSSPHNGIITIAAELGISGLFCLFAITYHLLRESYRVYKKCLYGYTFSIVTAIFSILIITVISQFISNSLIIPLPTERPMVQNSLILWTFFGMVAGVGKITQSAATHEIAPLVPSDILRTDKK